MSSDPNRPRTTHVLPFRKAHTDDDHKFIEGTMKAMLNRAFEPTEFEDVEGRFQALLDALGRVSERDG